MSYLFVSNAGTLDWLDSTDFVVKSAYTAKGVVLIASAASTPAAVAIGDDGQILKADSSEASGVVWETPTGEVVFGGLLNDLSDVTVGGYTDGQVLRADGSGFVNVQLAHSDLSGVGSNAHSVIDTHLANTSNPHTVTAAQAGAVALTGDENVAGVKTFSSIPVLPASSPTADNQAARKAYVDGLITGQPARDAVRAATAAALPACTYNNGTDGVGATLTGNANGALAAQDGITLIATDRLLVKNQAAALQNGIYTVTTVGDVSNPFVLTRATNFDLVDNTEVVNGAFCPVTEGTANANTLWMSTTTGTITIGTTGLTFTQLSSQPVYTAGNGLDLAAYEFSLDLKANDGLKIDTTELTVAYDDSSIGIVSNLLAVKALGVTNAMLAGSIADTKLSQLTTASKVSGSALTSLASIPGAAGVVPSANLGTGGAGAGEKLLADDGTFKTVGTTAASDGIVDIDILDIRTRWTKMPAATTELLGNTNYRQRIDLTNATQYRIIVLQSTAGYAGADLNLQYSTDDDTYAAADTASAGEVDVGAGIGFKVGAWADLIAGAKADVYLRLVGKDGDGSANPQFEDIRVQFKIPGGMLSSYYLKDLVDVADAVTDSGATGDIMLRGASTYSRLAISANDGDVLKSTGSTANYEEDTKSLALEIDNGATAVAVGVIHRVRIPFACTITRVSLGADAATTTTIDLWVDIHANYPPTVADSICAADKLALSAATVAEKTSFTGWTLTLAEGSWLFVNVDANDVATKLAIEIKVKRT